MDDSTRSLDATGVGGSAAPRPTELAIGETFGRYQVRRLLGHGGMGQVYLARDITLGRSVALKVIAEASDANRFFDEARAIARLNHPNIVQLYDFEVYRKGLVLALEYVDGVTLKERAEGVLELDEILRHLRAMADALAHAHATHVLHCDLKPSNVMIGRDGRVRVVDFGLAQVGPARRGGGGTPDWMAPEQWSGEPLTDRVDTWALGLIAATLFLRAHPLGDDADTRRRAVVDPRREPHFAPRREVPAAVAVRITQSLEHAPSSRPSALEWLQTLDEVLAGRDDLIEDGPYPGLTAFGEPHARNYFGRESEIDEFLERLRDAPALPIVGPSGAGKSSFLHAGVIPRLRKRGRWHVITFRPGADPIGALARNLLAASAVTVDRHEGASLRDELVATPTLFAARLATLAIALDSSLLVAIDQLEETFTQGASEGEQLAFVRMLLDAVDDPHDPVRLVFTVRDDFVGRLAGVRSLFVMQPLDDAALRRTIMAPLARYRYDLDDPQLVDDLLAEVATTGPAALPLLQFACRTLWDGRDTTSRTLRRATYQQMGGVAGALARQAERALASLPAAEQAVVRKLLLRLVVNTTRRTVARDDLLVSIPHPATSVVLDRLIESRLLVLRTPEDGDRPSVEIAHESLLSTWEQLARWLDESREERRLVDDLDAAATHWERRGARSEETWQHDELVAVRQRIKQLEVVVPAGVERFLAAGEQRQRQRVHRRRRRNAAAIVAAAVVAVVGGGAINRYLEREERIRTNVGTLDLSLAAYDRVDHRIETVALPPLTFELFEPLPDDLHSPGAKMPAGLARIERTRDGIRISAPGGTVFLAISNRGRDGDHCGPSWIRIQSFPGYTTARQRYAIAVPTCRATRFAMADISAGEFIYGGPGDPPSVKYGEPDYTLPERTLALPRFAIDRTEVSNGAYVAFAKLAQLSGYPAPVYSTETLHQHDGDPDRPLTNIDAATARAFCRYLGKELPTDPQWVKAARGGLRLGDAANPYPRRRYPWGPEPREHCVNAEGVADGFDWIAPVDAFACGASPYGVVNMVGNVQEWIARTDQPDPENPHHVMRGGTVDSPAELEQTTTLFVNHRDPRSFSYTTGFRCVETFEGGSGGR